MQFKMERMQQCIGIQVSRHLCAEVGFSPQCEPGTGRKGQSRQGPGASFHCWPCWAAVCGIGRASSVPTSSRSATGSSSGRVDDGRHHCFIVPCVPCSSSDQALTSHLVKSVVVKLQFCVALSGIHCLHCQDKIMYSCTIEAWHSFDSKMCQQSSGKIFMLCNAIFKS